MNSIKRGEFEIDSDEWNIISKKIQQSVVKVINKFGPNARKTGAKFYICINSDINYKSQDRVLNTRVRDLHTDLGQTLVEVKDVKSYIEDYIEMLQGFCENNNRGAIGSAGEFIDFDTVEIIISKPVAFL